MQSSLMFRIDLPAFQALSSKHWAFLEMLLQSRWVKGFSTARADSFCQRIRCFNNLLFVMTDTPRNETICRHSFAKRACNWVWAVISIKDADWSSTVWAEMRQFFCKLLTLLTFCNCVVLAEQTLECLKVL